MKRTLGTITFTLLTIITLTGCSMTSEHVKEVALDEIAQSLNRTTNLVSEVSSPTISITADELEKYANKHDNFTYEDVTELYTGSDAIWSIIEDGVIRQESIENVYFLDSDDVTVHVIIGNAEDSIAEHFELEYDWLDRCDYSGTISYTDNGASCEIYDDYIYYKVLYDNMTYVYACGTDSESVNKVLSDLGITN
jgi:hypothetical protein